MAGRHIALWRLIAALTLAVGLLHWTAIAWLATQWQEVSVLRSMATPMFTRVLSAAPPDRAPARAPLPARTRPHPPMTAATETQTVAIQAPPPTPDTEPAAPPETPAPTQPAVPAPKAAAAPPEPAPETAASLDSWPANTRLHYRVGGHFRGPLSGDAEVQWQRQGERYQVQLAVHIGWLAHLSMTSQGIVTATELRPEAFEELSGSRRRHVNFTAQELVYMDGTRQPRPEGVQDTASQFVELTHRFSQASVPLAVGQSVQVWLARPGGADPWTYDVVELETLSTPRHGMVEAFHLKPRALERPRGPITAEMWFAPTLQYLPVRIRISMDAQTWVDLLMDKIEQSDAAAPP
jgi:hypothetical protein